MSIEINGFITWIRTFLDDVYAPKGSGGNITLNDVYPVGSIYMSVNDVNPSTLFGGTWSKIEGAFLLASGRIEIEPNVEIEFANGASGGEAIHTLTTNEMPSHTHTQDSHNHSQNDHSHLLPNSVVVYNASLSRGLVSNASSTKVALNSTLSSQMGTIGAKGTNNATTATNQNTGGGQAHNNMPPYLAVNVWKRTA